MEEPAPDERVVVAERPSPSPSSTRMEASGIMKKDNSTQTPAGIWMPGATYRLCEMWMTATLVGDRMEDVRDGREVEVSWTKEMDR